MKKLIAILSLLIATSTQAQFTKAELQASGLTCSMCSFSTQKQLMKLTFIDSIGVDLEHTTFLLYFKKDTQVEIAQLRKKVEDAGFSVASLKLYYEFTNQQISDNKLNIQNTLFYLAETPTGVLNGLTALRIVDEGFVSEKEYKKYQKLFKTITPANTEKAYRAVL